MRRFLRSEDEMVGDTWEKKVAIKYYDKLFKEYCLADLSRHKVQPLPPPPSLMRGHVAL